MKTAQKLLLMVAFGLLACTRHEAPTSEDQLDQIQTQIDQQNYVAAQEQLEGILAAHPENVRARTILASLYVHKAGIRVVDYFQLEKLARAEKVAAAPLVKPELLESLDIPEKARLIELLAFINQMAQVSAQAQDWSERFEKIPVVDHVAATQLHQAVEELIKIESPDQGVSLYRAVIQLYYFRYLMKHELFLKIGERRVCSTRISVLSDQLDLFQKYVSRMILDMARGLNRSQPEFEAQISNFQKDFSGARVWLRGQKEAQLTVQEAFEQWLPAEKLKEFLCDF